MLVVTGKSLLSRVRFEAVRQLVRAAQRGGVPAVDLVRGDAQALPGDAAKETSGEQAIIAVRSEPAWGRRASIFAVVGERVCERASAAR